MKVFSIDLTCRTPPYDTHLVAGLRRAGVEVDLWLAGCLSSQSNGNCGRSVLDIASSASGQKSRKLAKGTEYLINGAGLHWKLQTEAPDIVHYQWLPFAEKIPFFAELNLRWAGRNETGVVYTVHNVLPHDTGNNHRSTFRHIYQIPDALICHTQQAKNQLIEDFEVPSDKIWIIPHGPLGGEIDCIPQEEARGRLHFDSEASLCLLFGHIRPYKGVEFLIDSWQHIREREPSARLILAGRPEDGYGKILFEKIEALGLEREIDAHFQFLPQEELSLYVQAADVLVYPYRSITQSGALLTGLTTGKPVVATDVGGFSEVIRHEQTGILVKYGDEAQMAEEMIRLLRDAERREQLGRAAQEMVETKYSWDTIAHKTLNCYRSVVKKS